MDLKIGDARKWQDGQENLKKKKKPGRKEGTWYLISS